MTYASTLDTLSCQSAKLLFEYERTIRTQQEERAKIPIYTTAAARTIFSPNAGLCWTLVKTNAHGTHGVYT